MVNNSTKEVIVRFVDIGMVELLTITVLEMIVSFVDIGMVELLTITVLEVIVSFVDIGGIVDHHCFRDDQQFHQYQQN
jgi:hypothetical protein